MSGAPVAVPGFVDAHTHLLKAAGGVPFPWERSTVAEYHRRVARDGGTPMDVLEPPPGDEPGLAARLRAGLMAAAAAGLVEVTEMGMCEWWYLDVLEGLERRAGELPVRVRIYLASGLAERAGPDVMDARRGGTGNWVRLDGVKFYSDGWLGPRTCAMGRPFADGGGDGLLFMDAGTLARRIEPLAARGWRIATHAIGDRGVATVLDAYELAWGGDAAAMSAAAPRIEHASVQSAGIISRMAESGVVACIQPSFAVTDAEQVRQALDPQRRASAYPWAALAAAGARLLAGTDYPIEVIEPLVGLARLVLGSSARTGFVTAECAPEGSRLDLATAFGLMTDAAAGQTLLSADPRSVPAGELDQVRVAGTAPVLFAIGQ
ncbi:MAG TPA: amidohydrolase family protein [Streptosporangiaceae bacterium]|nr:amidohydrolase family protein [Streptosporangiaceae bacterium]